MKRQGFTLIEMLSVMVIVSILSALSYPALSHAMMKTKSQAAALQLKNVWTGLKLYQNDNGGEVGGYESWESENYPLGGTDLADLKLLPADFNRQSPCGKMPGFWEHSPAVQYLHNKADYSRADAAAISEFKESAIMVVDPQCNAATADPKKQFWRKRVHGVNLAGILRTETTDKWQWWQSYFWKID